MLADVLKIIHLRYEFLCVFEGASPNISDLLRAFSDEHHLWCLAGARKLDALGPALATG